MQELESRNSLWSLVLRVHLVLEEFKVSLIKSEALGSLEGSGADRASSATREMGFAIRKEGNGSEMEGAQSRRNGEEGWLERAKGS